MPACIKVLLLQKTKLYIFFHSLPKGQCYTPLATNAGTNIWTVTKCIHISFAIYIGMCTIICSQTEKGKAFQETLLKPHSKNFTYALYLHANNSPCLTVVWFP